MNRYRAAAWNEVAAAKEVENRKAKRIAAEAALREAIVKAEAAGYAPPVETAAGIRRVETGNRKTAEAARKEAAAWRRTAAAARKTKKTAAASGRTAEAAGAEERRRRAKELSRRAESRWRYHKEAAEALKEIAAEIETEEIPSADTSSPIDQRIAAVEEAVIGGTKGGKKITWTITRTASTRYGRITWKRRTA